MKMEPGIPRRQVVLNYAPKVWRDMEKEEAKRRVLHGESILVRGIAGVGKSHWLKECVEELHRALMTSIGHLVTGRPNLRGNGLVTTTY